MKVQSNKSVNIVKKYGRQERLNATKFSFLGDLNDKKVLDTGGGKGTCH